MNFVLNILKAFLINFLFIGIIHAATTCPSISPQLAGDAPTEQVEAIINDVVCAFIDLRNQNNGSLTSTLNLTKKKIIPFIDLEYSTELALGDHWKNLNLQQKKIFERDIKNSLIKDYVPYLVDYPDWENINIVVDKNFSQNENFARVKLHFSIQNDGYPLTIILKLIQSERWKIYDLDIQSVSLIDIFKIGYDSKIKRQGIERLIDKMLSKS
ncbi:MAG: ABC transporter substrate-binding protein [Candidatus Thioglobus sp.]|nr:ABC transporter substrate-binding protein [Candidatus Thioglobus sp.]